MLTPSYSTLIRTINEDNSLDQKITSRYSIVIAAAKRARQIVGGAEHEPLAGSDKAVSVAINELYNGHIKIVPKEGASAYDDHEHVVQNMPTLIDDSYVTADEISDYEPKDPDDPDAEADGDDWDDDEDEEENDEEDTDE